jgi:hypothetical protein
VFDEIGPVMIAVIVVIAIPTALGLIKVVHWMMY